MYDGLGRRVSTVKPDQSKQIHVYTQDGVLVMSTNQVSTGAVAETRYVYLNGSQIAELGIAFIHTDGLRSPVARVDGNRVILSRTRYEPYGLTAAGATPTVGYTGHVNDANTGLVYMQQRYYDPVAARFVSIDPVTTDPNTGGSFNRYAYANNSPYQYVDPDGQADEVIETITITGKRERKDPFASPVSVGAINFLESIFPDSSISSKVIQPPPLLDKLGNCAIDQLGLSDLAGAGAVAAGWPIPGTKRFVTPGTASGTSLAGLAADKIFGQAKLPFRMPTINGGPGTGRALGIAYTKSAARFAGRMVPMVGWGLFAYDGVKITNCTVAGD